MACRKDQSLELAVKSTKLVRSLTKDNPGAQDTEWAYEFSPKTFSGSDPVFVVRLCEAGKAAWEPNVENPITFNLPATFEMSTPNVYADKIEYFAHNFPKERRFVSLYTPHNDRGYAVAAAELAQMAGADRVEGRLFGNVELFTLALNLYIQGISPNIDLVEVSTKIPVNLRASYGGQLVVCAFSGTH